MSHLMRKLVKNIENMNDDEACENQEETSVQVVQTKPRRTMRGKTAALLASLKNDDGDDEDIKDSKCGVYASQIIQTKEEAKHIHKNFEDVDKAIVVESMQENMRSKKTASSDEESDPRSASSSDLSSDEEKTFKKKKSSNNKSDCYSPPPPPIATVTRRRSGRQSVVERQLMQLERDTVKLKTTATLEMSEQMIDIEPVQEEETVSVKVLTASGLKRFTVKENEQFRVIYEKLSELEEKSIESLILMLKDKKIGFNETPKSIGLKNYDIIECGKHAAPAAKERIRVVDDKKDESNEAASPDEVIIMLQTLEGRKSRVKYLINKDEKLINCMRKYCQDKKLDSSLHILEFDGDLVEADDTPNSLGLDGDEMFDVKKSSKPTSEVIRQNQSKYEFDADILIA